MIIGTGGGGGKLNDNRDWGGRGQTENIANNMRGEVVGDMM